MKNIKTISLALFLALFIATSCTKKDAPARHIDRLDTALAEYASLSAASQTALADSLAPGINAMFSVMGRDSVGPSELLWWSSSDVVSIFQPDVNAVYPDISSLEHDLGQILAKAQADSLNLPPLQFYTVTWGRPEPIVRVDSVVLIALNHYLGADYPGYSHWESFRRTRKTPEALPYDLATVLAATTHQFSNPNPTLLDWMLYEGALVQAAMQLVPDANLASALGYTPEELKFAQDNYETMRQEMAMRRMYYDTDPVLIDRLIVTAPFSPLLEGKAPGRIGRYIGYRLIKDYTATHPSTPLSRLLSLTPSDIQ